MFDDKEIGFIKIIVFFLGFVELFAFIVLKL
jgi:hypothetical protein